MLKRTLVGAAVLATLLAAWWWDKGREGGPDWATAGLGTLILLGALGELLTLGGAKPARRAFGLVLGAVWLGLLLLPALDGGAVASLVGGLLLPGASIVASLLIAAQIPRGPGPVANRLAGSLWFQVPYVGGLGCLLALLAHGALDFAVALTVIAKSSDIGAYFGGSLFGRRKLAPAISPGKTVEGAIGGVILPALAAAWLLRSVPIGADPSMPMALSLVESLAYGIVIGVIAVTSDLSESLLKRSRAVKDSSRVLGQAGGFLDLVDSLLLVGPCALAYTSLLT
ncbi:MAG: phosphatidate cytidylyltransferase [Planctomycetota bacterium]